MLGPPPPLCWPPWPACFWPASSQQCWHIAWMRNSVERRRFSNENPEVFHCHCPDPLSVCRCLRLCSWRQRGPRKRPQSCPAEDEPAENTASGNPEADHGEQVRQVQATEPADCPQ